MISIDGVGGTRYDFPTIDFKFQNSGNATAFLWQFGVTVLRAEVDVTPVLRFWATVEDAELHVHAANYGWGAAQDCSIQIDEPALTRAFPPHTRRFHGTIGSGEEPRVLRLAKDVAQPGVLEGIAEAPAPVDGEPDKGLLAMVVDHLGHSGRRSADQQPGAVLGDVRIDWRCTDEKGRGHAGQETTRFGGLGWGYALTSGGFTEVTFFEVNACMAGSDAMYVSMIDPTKGAQERLYPISRKIASGDIERFHIMIGATMSCFLRLKFEFFVGKEAVVESDEFDVHIVNLRDRSWRSRMEHRYRDGSELHRDLRSAEQEGDSDWLRRWPPLRPERLRRLADSFPFLPADEPRREGF